MSRIGKSIETESRFVVIKAWGKAERGTAAKEEGVSLQGDGNVLESEGGNGCTTLNVLRDTKLCTLKRFVLYEFHLNFKKRKNKGWMHAATLKIYWVKEASHKRPHIM